MMEVMAGAERGRTVSAHPSFRSLSFTFLVVFLAVLCPVSAAVAATAGATSTSVWFSQTLFNDSMVASSFCADGDHAAWLSDEGPLRSVKLGNVDLRTVTVISGLWSAYDLAIDGNHLAWRGEDSNRQRRLYLYHIESGSLETVGTAGQPFLLADDHVFWVEDGYRLMTRPVDGDKPQVLFDEMQSQGHVYPIAAENGTFIWKYGYPHVQLMATNTANGFSQPIVEVAFGSELHLETDGRYVVWSERDMNLPGVSWIRFYDLATGTYRDLTALPHDNYGPCLDNGHIAWLGRRDKNNKRPVLLYDIATGVTTDITNGRYPQEDPQMEWPLVAWKSQDGIAIFDAEADTMHSVAGKDVERFRLSGQRLCWSSGRIDASNPYGRILISSRDGEVDFTDVSYNHPYAAAIFALAKRGIISGYGDGTFRPDNPVLRQQFAKMIVKTLGCTVTGAESCPFADVRAQVGDDPFYPSKYIAVCVERGIIKGR